MRAVKNDITSVSLDTVFFRNGGKRSIRPLKELEWRAVTFQDPPQFVAAVLNLYMDVNRVGTSIIQRLMQIRFENDAERALKYHPNRRFRGFPLHFQNSGIQSLLSELLAGRKAVPDYMVVVLADTLGIPEEEFNKRASSATSRYLQHQTEMQMNKVLSPKEEELADELHQIFGDLPMRYSLSSKEMIAIAKRMKAALPSK